MGDIEITPDMDAGHVKYMDERPGSHGLFSQEEGIPDMTEIQKELINHKGLSWRWVLSLEESDAVNLGYINREVWEKTLRATMKDATAAMGISESNLRWVAAFHRKKGHPHVHILLWEKEPKRKQGELSEGELRDIKRIFMREIDEVERTRLEVEKTALRDLIRDTAKKSILDLARDQAGALIGEAPGLEPVMTPEARCELAEKLNELAAIMPGRGRIALKYMPKEVKEKAREISAWLLGQPGFLNSTEKYRKLSEELAKYFVKKDEKLKEAADRAFNDIRDRVAQLVLKGAADIQKVENIIEQKPDEADYELSETKEYIEAGGSGQDKAKSISEKATERLWRTVCFSLGTEYRRLFPNLKILRPKIEKELKDELTGRLNMLAAGMSDHRRKPSYVYLPEELKKQARETAQWLLNRPELQNRFKELEDEDKEKLIGLISDHVVSRAYELLPGEIPEDLRFAMHGARRDIAVYKMRDADADLVADDYEEAVWTAGAIYRAMVYLKEKEDEAWKAAEGFAAKAGISDNDLKNAVDREIKRIEYIKEKGLPEIVGRDDWQRLGENQGLKEEEFLRPWFGIKEKDENEIKARQKFRDELGVKLVEERIAGVLEVFKNSSFHPQNPNELRWTITTMAAALKAIGINESERANIVRNWCQRSGLEITEARLRDVLDRAELSEEDIWLGKRSWSRLMENLGIEEEKTPECPWQVGRPMPLSERIAAGVWKSAWKSLEKERSKAEAQSRYASLMAEKKAEMKAKRSRMHDAAIEMEME